MEFHSQYNDAVKRMIDYVDNDSTDLADDVMQLKASSYTDPAVWNAEMEKIFKRLPMMVGLSVEIPEPGCFKTLSILGVPLLVTRQQDGSAKVMLNVCSHRGMKLTSEPCGERRLFTCPYHSWSYGIDGRLRGVAEPKKFGKVEREELGLTVLASYERGGLIFAALTPGDTPDFEGFLSGMIDDVEKKGFENWHFCGKREVYGANWKVAYDGYLEGYHFAAAHPETINPRTYSNIMDFEAHGPHIRIGFPQRSIDKLKAIPDDQLWQHENDGYDFIRLFFPNISIFVAPEITQIAQLIPGPTPGENTTILYFLKPDSPKDEAETAENEAMVDFLQTVVDKEDYQLGLQVQRGLEADPGKTLMFGRNERGNQYFHRWVDYYINNDGSQAEPTL
ncbi:MAG: aromatic ring-hydroxylating dioxygenase subunit alpha [Chromatocurvus sp.]